MFAKLLTLLGVFSKVLDLIDGLMKTVEYKRQEQQAKRNAELARRQADDAAKEKARKVRASAPTGGDPRLHDDGFRRD